MAEWRECSLESVCSRLSSGKGISAKLISESGGYPVYGGNGIRGYTDTSNFKGECAIVGRQGAYCGNVRYFRGEAYMTEHAVVVCANEDNCTRYLAYLLATMNLGRLSAQSAQPGLSVKTLGKQEIRMPDKKVQLKCAELLGSLDEKISHNEEVNKNLEQQAQALFISWFVDYTPFNGVKPGLWKNMSVYELAEYINGAAFKKNEYADKGLPIIKITELKNGITDATQYCCTEKDVKYYIDDRDILFSWSGNPDTSIDTFLWSNGKAILNQHTFRVVSKYNAPAFTFFLLKYLKPQFTHIASNKQTTGLGHVTVADLKRLQFCADENAIRDFNAITMPFFDMIFSNYKENQYLSSLRDTILPQLMSGELDVSEIDL